jgi:hypothetical protein
VFNKFSIIGIGRDGLAAMPAALVAQDESTNRVATETDWSVFVEDDPTQCWVVSQPTETVNTRDGNEVQVNRGDILMFVSFWPSQNRMGEVSFTGGYPYPTGMWSRSRSATTRSSSTPRTAISTGSRWASHGRPRPKMTRGLSRR